MPAIDPDRTDEEDMRDFPRFAYPPEALPLAYVAVREFAKAARFVHAGMRLQLTAEEALLLSAYLDDVLRIDRVEPDLWHVGWEGGR